MVERPEFRGIARINRNVIECNKHDGIACKSEQKSDK